MKKLLRVLLNTGICVLCVWGVVVLFPHWIEGIVPAIKSLLAMCGIIILCALAINSAGAALKQF